MKTMTSLIAALACAHVAANAVAEEVRAVNIVEKTYIAGVKGKSDGTNALIPGSYWTGEKVVVRDGKCLHVKQDLTVMKKIPTPAGEYEVPELKTISAEVPCAARKVGSLVW